MGSFAARARRKRWRCLSAAFDNLRSLLPPSVPTQVDANDAATCGLQPVAANVPPTKVTASEVSFIALFTSVSVVCPYSRAAQTTGEEGQSGSKSCTRSCSPKGHYEFFRQKVAAVYGKSNKSVVLHRLRMKRDPHSKRHLTFRAWGDEHTSDK